MKKANRGLDNAGKTTIVNRLNGEDIDTIPPTFGFQIRTFVYGKYTLNIWDVGGQRILRPYWRNYFERTDALVWVVDSSDHMRMKDCKEELHSLLQEDALNLDLLTTHKWKIQPCSAVKGTNLVEGLDWVVEEVAGRLYFGSTSVKTENVPEEQLMRDKVDLEKYAAFGKAEALSEGWGDRVA
ncbi:hypothetical protein FRB90_009286 [Tulasnella sp. 427]|nr:hypothetical protein FRB90_009286 [Tulasnella sp. 427]